MTPYFDLQGDKIIASEHCAGPWDPTMQHGGAISGLIAHLVDTHPAPVPMQVSRLTIDLKRPVPMGELDLRTEVTREGRNIQTLQISIYSDGKECVRASALRIRKAEFDMPENVLPPSNPFDPVSEPMPARFAEGFNEGMTIHEATGKPGQMRTAAWFHYARPFFADLPTTPLMRAAVTGDYSNGFGSRLDFNEWTYINADLTLHFARQPVGERIMLTANAWIDGNGSGISYGELSDELGFFGRSTQSLVIAKRS